MAKIITANALLSKQVTRRDRVLLLNPPVEETRYSWVRWNQPLDLLKIASRLRSHVGCGVELLDCMKPDEGGKVAEDWLPRDRRYYSVKGERYPMRRFGTSYGELTKKLTVMRQVGAKKVPTQIWISSLCSYWYESVAEVCRIVQQTLPDTAIAILGQYARLMPKHAAAACAADFVVAKPPDLSDERGAFDLYGEKQPPFVALELNPVAAVPEVRMAVERGVLHFTFFEEDVCRDDGRPLLEIFTKTKGLHKHLRYHFICGLDPAKVTPLIAGVLADRQVAEAHFEEAEAGPELDVQAYQKVRAYLREAGLVEADKRLSGFVWIGRPGDQLERIVLRSFEVLNHLEGLILKPYTPTPGSPEHRESEPYLAAIPHREWSPHFFPFAELNGITRGEYHDLYRMAAFLNEKIRDESFDFLNGTLVPRCCGRVSAERCGTLNRRRSALLISPPVYDTQYWAHWSLPYGLLRVASWLRNKGYLLKLIDCLEADNENRSVQKKMRKVRKLCSTEEYVPPRWSGFRPAEDEKIEYCFGLPPDELRKKLQAIQSKARAAKKSLVDTNVFPEPDEIWISSIMTYWWESTKDIVAVCREVFPKAVLRIGGIYPTLAPEHAIANLGLRDPLHLQGRELDPLSPNQKRRDIIVSATIPDANPLPLLLDLYKEDGTGEPEPGGDLPQYTILTTSRGCPFKCAYCAANVLNEGRKVWVREFGSAYEEVKHWFSRGIREFCFYEDNLLLGKSNFIELIQRIADDPDLDGIELHAPEGIEVRLLHPHVVKLMRKAGFKRLYLPLETVNVNMQKQWDRTHTNMDNFFYALENAVEAGYKLHCQDINCFVLFGLPDEDLQAVYDTLVFASSRVGSVIPMLFTPVPSTPMFEMYRDYLEEKGFDFHHLNGKLMPFLDYNRRKYKGLSVRDYYALEGLMWRINTKVRSESFNLGGMGRVAAAFREEFMRYDKAIF